MCHKRKLVTIATHNMAALTPPLLYDARPLEDVSLTPLGYTQPTTAKDFMALLQENKLPARAGKKNNKPKKAGVVDAEKKIDPIAASLSKYLDLVEGRDEIAMLSDSTSCVFSLPPLTNSEVTKVRTVCRVVALCQDVCMPYACVCVCVHVYMCMYICVHVCTYVRMYVCLL